MNPTHVNFTFGSVQRLSFSFRWAPYSPALATPVPHPAALTSPIADGNRDGMSAPGAAAAAADEVAPEVAAGPAGPLAPVAAVPIGPVAAGADVPIEMAALEVEAEVGAVLEEAPAPEAAPPAVAAGALPEAAAAALPATEPVAVPVELG